MFEQTRHSLPQTGNHLDSEWADAMEVSLKQFRKNIRDDGVPYMMSGSRMIVNAEDFYQRLREISPFNSGNEGE
ncbi:MAG: hypothetical protein KDA80_19770 [Planctomycetaceae bacterium]|nr:hypothetical protein [Planctomycetaceae bacterium]